MDKEQLFKPRLAERDVDIEGVGTVRVRALSRDEVLAVQAMPKLNSEPDTAKVERKILSLGLVEPSLTEGEVFKWQAASPAGELEPVVEQIQILSGMSEDADKQAMRDFRGGPGTGDGVLSSTEAGDDGQSDAAGSVE